MMIQNKSIFLITLILIIQGCGKSSHKPADYVSWCDSEESALIKEYQQNELKLTCQYLSPEYAVLKQNDPTNLIENEIRNNIEAVSDLWQFKLKFEDTGSRNFLKNYYTTAEQFNTRSMYLSYDIQFDFKLVEGTDTLDCAMNHHERAYGNTPFETLLISFPRIHESFNDLELIFDDRVFGFGRVKFFFDKDVLESIPELVF